MEVYKIYAGGEFVETKEILEVTNSYDNSLVANTFLAGEAEFELSVQRAISVAQQMKEMPTFQRYEILMQIADSIKSDKMRLATVLALEACKPIKYSLIEIERAIQTFIVAAEESKRIKGEFISIDWNSSAKNKEAWLKYFPVGIIAAISPFNFPMNLAVHKIAPAIASGCPIVLKPARSTPLSTLELSKIIDKTSLPKGAISILPMDRVIGNQLVTDERFKLLTFTGSSDVGWNMKKSAGKKKVVLELGGNAGLIVTETADIERAISKSIIGSFAYSGQVCIHLQRIYVHESMFKNFIDLFLEKVKNLKAGNPLNSDTDISSMVDEENAQRVENWINEAIENGAKLLFGGKRKGSFVEPTVLTNTNSKMKVNSSEVFGPVVIIEKYNDFIHAVDLVNDSEFGLQAGVFTNKISEMNYAFDNLNVGGVMINESPSFRADQMPYGGIKNSGLGREGLKYAIHEMLESKLLVKEIR